MPPTPALPDISLRLLTQKVPPPRRADNDVHTLNSMTLTQHAATPGGSESAARARAKQVPKENVVAHGAGGGTASAKGGGALRARSNGHDAASAAVQDLTEQVCARMQPLRGARLAVALVSCLNLLQPRQHKRHRVS